MVTVAYVVGNIWEAEQAGTLDLARQALEPVEIEFRQCPVRLKAAVAGEIISSAIGIDARHVLVTEVFADEATAIQELTPLAAASRIADERSAGHFNPLVLASVQRDEQAVLVGIVWRHAKGWVARYYGKRELVDDKE